MDSRAEDIIYSNLFTGVHGNYLRSSIIAAGLDPASLPQSDASAMNFGGGATKAWRDIWGAGQGVGSIAAINTTADRIMKWKQEYESAKSRL